MKPSLTVDLIKKNIIVRVSHILHHLTIDATTKELAGFLGVSTSSYYAIKRGNVNKVSLNLLIGVMERLGLKYTLTVGFNGKTRTVNVTGIETAVGIQYRGIRRQNGIQLQRI